MIWLLLNVWWLVPALVAACALLALLSGIGWPVLAGLARRVPAPAWSALALVLGVSLASSWLIGTPRLRCIW